jgi:hypothetical protein
MLYSSKCIQVYIRPDKKNMCVYGHMSKQSRVGRSALIMSPKQSLGDILCLLRFLLLSSQTKLGNLLFLHRFLLLFFFPPLLLARFCPTKFSETDDPIFSKLHRKVDPHLKKLHSAISHTELSVLAGSLSL